MARPKPIRITKNDRREYAKLAKNTKAKIKRTSKTYGIDLSGEIPVPKLESFQTREEYNEWKEKARSFTNRNNLTYQFKKNQYGVVANKKLLGQLERENKRNQRVAEQIAKEAAPKPFISGGKVQGTVGQQMLQMGRPNVGGVKRPPDFNFNDIRSYQRLKTVQENINRRSDPAYYDKRKETMKENFIFTLGLSFNSNADELVRELQKIPAEDFYEMYLMFDEFDFSYYDSEQIGVVHDEDNINQMLTYIKRYKRGDIPMPLKGF